MPFSEAPLHTIIFVSSAMKHFSRIEIKNFLDPLRIHRRQKNLSGLVIYANGNALSLIEGEKTAVESEYQAIKSHPGHHNMIKLFDKPVSKRYFEDFCLAFKAVNSPELKSIDDFEAGGGREYWEECIALSSEPVIKIINDFIKNNS